MPLPALITQEEHASLSDILKTEYKPDGDKFMLDVDPRDSGLGLADVSKLQKALVSEREAAKKAKAMLANFKDLDPEKAREALEFKTKFDDGQLDDESRARLEAKEKQLIEKYTAQQQKLETALQGAEERAKKREAQLLTELQRSTVEAAVREAIGKHNGVGKLLEPVIKNRVRLSEEDDKFHIQVVGDDGSPMLSRRSNSTMNSMSVEEFVETLKTDPDYQVAFRGSGSSGGGSQGQSSSVPNGVFRISTAEAKNPHAYRQAREAAAKAGKTLELID